MALVKTVEMRVLADAGDAQAKLDELDAKAKDLDGNAIRMRFRVESEEGKAQLDAIEARAKALGFSDVTIKVKVDGAGRAIADLEAVKHEEESVRNAGIMNRIGNLAGGIGGAIPGGLGPVPLPALAAAVPLIGALATEILGLASGFAAAGAGAGAFYLLAHPAINNLQQDVQALSKANMNLGFAQQKYLIDPTKKHAAALHEAQVTYDAIYRQMGQDAGPAAAGMLKLHDAYVKMSNAFAPAAFKVIGDGLKVITNLLPAAAPFANTFASALDKLLQQAAKFTASKGFSDWLKQFHSLEGPAIQSIGTGIANVANAFGKLMTTMSGKDVAHAINIAFGAISGTINVTASAIHTFMQNFDGMKAAATSAVHGTVGAFKSMASGVSSAVSAVLGAWKSMVSGIKSGISAALSAISALPGQIKAFFSGAAGWLLAAGKAIIQGLINGIESMLGPLGGVVSKIAGFISRLKGPLEYDRILLVPHGRAIMSGLIAGIQSQLPALEAAAKKAAAIIAARVKTEIAYAKSVAAGALSGLGLTSIDLTQGTVATGMQSYLASIKAFIAEIRALSAQHLNKSLLQQLIAAGPVTGGQYAESILQGGGAGPVNALYKQIQQQSALLGAQAAMSVYGGHASPKGDTYNITVQGGLITDKQALALEIVKMLRQYKRHGGGVPLGIG